MQVQLPNYVGSMKFNRFGRHIQHRCNLFGAVALGDELKDLALPWGELFDGTFPVVDALEVILDEAA